MNNMQTIKSVNPWIRVTDLTEFVDIVFCPDMIYSRQAAILRIANIKCREEI